MFILFRLEETGGNFWRENVYTGKKRGKMCGRRRIPIEARENRNIGNRLSCTVWSLKSELLFP